MFLSEFVIIVLMLVFNAFFAAYEMALASVSKTTLKTLLEEKKPGAKQAVFMKGRIEASLAVVQLGITLVGAIAAAVGGAGAEEAFVPYFKATFGLSETAAEVFSLALVIIPLSAVVIMFGELVPKTFALGNKEWVCLKFSPLMRILWFVFYPAVWILEKVVKVVGAQKVKKGFISPDLHLHELKAAASMARTSRLISARQEKILHSTTEFSRKAVKDVLVPVSEMSTISVKLSLSEALIKAHLDMHTRFPVCEKEDDPQSIIGYVNFKDIVFAMHMNPTDPTLRGITRPIKTVSANATISATLEELIQASTHIAIAKNEAGKVVGLLTLEGLIEELVGDIQDEYDKLPASVHAHLNGWMVGGGTPMNMVASALGVPAIVGQTQENRTLTLSEWCQLQKNGPLKSGEMIEKENLTVFVRKLRRKRLLEAFVIKKI